MRPEPVPAPPRPLPFLLTRHSHTQTHKQRELAAMLTSLDDRLKSSRVVILRGKGCGV